MDIATTESGHGGLRGISAFLICLGLICLGALTLAAAPARATLAHGDDFDEQHIIREFSPATLQPVLAELGATNIEQDRNGAEALYLTAELQTGLIVILTPSACTEAPMPKCRGLSLGAIFEAPADKPAAAIDARLAGFNRDAIGKAVRLDERSVMYRDYIIADYGIAQGNVRVALQVFEQHAVRMREYLAQ